MFKGEINCRDWMKRKDPYERAAYRQGEEFRLALQDACEGAGHGVQRALATDIEKHETYVANILKGRRVPDFKVCCAVAYYFNSDLATFLQRGKALAEGYPGRK